VEATVVLVAMREELVSVAVLVCATAKKQAMNQITAHRPGFIIDNIIQKLPLAKPENPHESESPSK
jgi:hypothetical protein